MCVFSLRERELILQKITMGYPASDAQPLVSPESKAPQGPFFN